MTQTSNIKRLILKEGKDKSLLRYHPWVFSGAIAKKDENIEEGNIVEIYSSNNEYLATGLYENGSITVKILSFEKEKIDKDFFFDRIQQAIYYRQIMGYFSNENTNIFRLINAEGDFLPSLIADYYDGNIVLQFHSVGMYNLKNLIISALTKLLPNIKTIFSKSSSTLPQNNIVDAKDEFLYQQSNEEFFTAKENDCTFLIDYRNGQKTGFFVDQQDNRNILSKFSKDKTVLNCFCYTGGFSVAALKGGAKHVDSIDISHRAIEICDKNVAMNDLYSNHKSMESDVVKYISTIDKGKYDIIVLDPPAFAKHRGDIPQAIKGYRKINLAAMEKIKNAGLLFTFSCSGVINDVDFRTMLFSSAAGAKRKVRIVKQLSHNPSHPQSIFHPEGEYLKGYLLYISDN